MPRLIDQLFNIDFTRTEGALGLARSAAHRRRQFRFRDPRGACLCLRRPPRLSAKRDNRWRPPLHRASCNVFEAGLSPGHNAALPPQWQCGAPPSSNPCCSIASSGRSDKLDPGLAASFRESCILTQKSVAGMNCLGAWSSWPPRESARPRDSFPSKRAGPTHTASSAI